MGHSRLLALHITTASQAVYKGCGLCLPAGWAHTDGGWLAHLSGSLENSGTPNQGRAPSRTAGKPAWAAARTTTTSMATITTTPPVATVSSCSRGGGSHVQQHRAAERWGLSGAPGVDVCQAKSNPDQDR